jgi:uncharacterized protein YndB with AHSA1/START domain
MVEYMEERLDWTFAALADPGAQRQEKETAVTPTPLRIVRVLSASAEEAFDAWIDPESLAVWMTPGSVVRSLVEVDARVGGSFRIVMKGPDRDHEHRGQYLVLERPHRLVFTWISDATRGRPSTVSVEIRSRGNREVELTLTHEGLPDEAVAAKHRSGWGDILRNLGAALEARRDPTSFDKERS